MGVPQSSILVGFSLRKTIHLTSIWRDPHFRKPPYVLVKKWGWVCTPENGDGTVAERDRMTLFCGFFWCNGSMNSVWGYWNVYLQITMGIYYEALGFSFITFHHHSPAEASPPMEPFILVLVCGYIQYTWFVFILFVYCIHIHMSCRWCLKASNEWELPVTFPHPVICGATQSNLLSTLSPAFCQICSPQQ